MLLARSMFAVCAPKSEWRELSKVLGLFVYTTARENTHKPAAMWDPCCVYSQEEEEDLLEATWSHALKQSHALFKIPSKAPAFIFFFLKAERRCRTSRAEGQDKSGFSAFRRGNKKRVNIHALALC